MDAQRRVGPYTLLSKLGEGGMGIVYLAHDPSSAPVALKVLRPELAGREDFRRRFTREAEAARQVACTATSSRRTSCSAPSGRTIAREVGAVPAAVTAHTRP